MSALGSSGTGASPRVEASIFGESALIDRETGRVYWECGNTNTLYESLAPKLDQFGVEHAQATFLTIMITLAFLSVLSGWLRRVIDSCYDATATATTTATATSLLTISSSWSAKTLSVLVVLAEYTLLKLPKIENKYLVLAFVVLYFFESYHCSTRCFLANAVSSATELDAYIDGLTQQPPVVIWTVQTFHYELRRLFAVPRMIRSWIRGLQNSRIAPQLHTPMPTSTSTSTTPKPILCASASASTAPLFLITRKVVTNEASATYRYASCSDKTIAGVWSRAESDERVPFRKISLSKVLVLSDRRSREDYFQQQSDFVTRYGREDEYAEFSTSIEVAGYRPRLLVARSSTKANSCRGGYTKTKQKMLARISFFWVFTCLGLTVPYRVWFKRHCEFLRVTVVKETSAKGISDVYLRNWFPSKTSLRFHNRKMS